MILQNPQGYRYHSRSQGRRGYGRAEPLPAKAQKIPQFDIAVQGGKDHKRIDKVEMSPSVIQNRPEQKYI